MLFGERIPIKEVFTSHEAKSLKLKAQRMRQILEEYTLPILDKYSDKLGIKYRKLTIRKTKSKR